MRLVSLMSENSDFLYRGLATYLSRQTGIRIEVIDDVPWWERQRMLEEGGAQIGFVCGIVYTRWVDGGGPAFELLAAPVPSARRYGGRAIYFSDVVVRRDSCFRSFADLHGASWAYNEPGSHSGYTLTRYHLARLGRGWEYFGRVVEAGSHLRALESVLDGKVDASAIDSTVLDLERARRPELAGQLRVIRTFGPSPAPPGVVSAAVDAGLRDGIRRALLDLHLASDAAPLLAEARLSHYAAVRDADYQPIRRMARIAERAPAPASLAPAAAA